MGFTARPNLTVCPSSYQLCHTSPRAHARPNQPHQILMWSSTDKTLVHSSPHHHPIPPHPTPSHPTLPPHTPPQYNYSNISIALLFLSNGDKWYDENMWDGNISSILKSAIFAGSIFGMMTMGYGTREPPPANRQPITNNQHVCGLAAPPLPIATTTTTIPPNSGPQPNPQRRPTVHPPYSRRHIWAEACVRHHLDDHGHLLCGVGIRSVWWR